MGELLVSGRVVSQSPVVFFWFSLVFEGVKGGFPDSTWGLIGFSLFVRWKINHPVTVGKAYVYTPKN